MNSYTSLPTVPDTNAFVLWGLALEHQDTGLLVSCPSVLQASRIRKSLYAARSRERKNAAKVDEYGITTPGSISWDSFSIVMCYDPESFEYQMAVEAHTDPNDAPKAIRSLIPAFLFLGTLDPTYAGAKAFHPTSGMLLEDFGNTPKFPPRAA